MKTFLLTLSLIFSTNLFAQSNTIEIAKNSIIDITTLDNEIVRVEDIEEKLVQIPNVEINNDKVLIKLNENKKSPVSNVLLTDRRIIMPFRDLGGGDGGGGWGGGPGPKFYNENNIQTVVNEK